MKTFNIKPISRNLEAELKHKIDLKTKPLGALGELEKIALRIGLIHDTLSPQLNKPHIVVFAGDHGIAKEGVSAYPQEVTYQMVMNFVRGGAAINVFCRQNKIEIKVVDAGVNYDFPKTLPIIHAKVGMATKNFLREPAMSPEQLEQCLKSGSAIVRDITKQGCNVIGFGEMGIGNTSSASMLMSALLNLPIEECVGSGTGLDTAGRHRKIEILKQAQMKYKKAETSLGILQTFGGFEIAQMCGAMLQAAENKMLILVDGFIATAAFLVVNKANPSIKDYAIFTHQSDEYGHAKMLAALGVEPLIQLNMRLGEGSGAAVCYPIVQSAVNFLNEMASFESAGVTNKGEG